MLVLTRRVGETIEIGGSNGIPLIVVSLEMLGADKARLGFTAPDTVKILRSELARDIEENGVRGAK